MSILKRMVAWQHRKLKFLSIIIERLMIISWISTKWLRLVLVLNTSPCCHMQAYEMSVQGER